MYMGFVSPSPSTRSLALSLVAATLCKSRVASSRFSDFWAFPRLHTERNGMMSSGQPLPPHLLSCHHHDTKGPGSCLSGPRKLDWTKSNPPPLSPFPTRTENEVTVPSCSTLLPPTWVYWFTSFARGCDRWCTYNVQASKTRCPARSGPAHANWRDENSK